MIRHLSHEVVDLIEFARRGPDPTIPTFAFAAFLWKPTDQAPVMFSPVLRQEHGPHDLNNVYMAKPEDYLEGGDAPHYIPLPVYQDEELGHDLHLCEGDTTPLACNCHTYERGSCWPDETNCICLGLVTPHDTQPCEFDECPSCRSNPRHCKVRIGCECRKMAMPGNIFVCSMKCHAGNGPGCGMKVGDSQPLP